MIDEKPGGDINPVAEDDSVRSALEAAFDGWSDDDKSEAPVAGKEAATEAKPETLPKDQQADTRTAGERARDEKGRFAAKDATAPADQTQQPPVQQSALHQQVEQPAPQSIEGKPPPGWSVASKAAWDRLPPEVRADIAKREQEVDNGFAQLRDFKGLKPYADMARNSGTTLDAALQNYVGMEQLLRRDFKQGVMAIAQNMGVSPQQFKQMFGASQPHQNGQAAPSQGVDDDPYIREAVNPLIAPLMEKVSSLESTLQSRIQADQERLVGSAAKVVDEFRSKPEYRYFSDVEETISRLFDTGIVQRTGDFRADLDNAYNQACMLHPEVREAIINDRLSKAEAERQAAADKALAEKRAKTEAAQRAAVSVRGAPSGSVSAPIGSKGSVREDLLAAFDAHD